MSNSFLKLLCFTALCHAAELRLLPEYHRPDPFGAIVAPDHSPTAFTGKLAAARNGYVSLQIVATSAKPATLTLTVNSPLPTDLYRAWFHRTAPTNAYYPDALIPVTAPHQFALPDPANRIPNQTAQAFWLDIWVPAATAPGPYKATVTVTENGQSQSVPIEIEVLPAIIPAEDAVIIDHNSYGTAWLFGQYPKTLPADNDDKLFSLIHSYHRQFYEHRGVYHQLGYGHGGKVGPEFAPVLTGSGKNKRIASWERYDKHYGPLFDGSAFRETRRGPKPIPYVYLPINPDWPASDLWWGEPGYEAEFTNIVSAMERHFREKNWTATNFELFFNHKKRYKGFSWDGDEQRFARDNEWLVTYRKLLDKSVPPNSPVKFLTRIDTSWTMKEQFTSLKGIVNFWVAGEGILSWYPGSAQALRARGDHIWSYGGTPPVTKPLSMMTLNPLRSWITGVEGFCRWQTVDPGPDPWFQFQGGGETLVYPGDRFGIAAPLASIRLKVERNAQQDLALLEAQAKAANRESVFTEVLKRFNNTSPADWVNTAPPLASTPVLDWNNVNIDEAQQAFESKFEKVDVEAWSRVHDYAIRGKK